MNQAVFRGKTTSTDVDIALDELITPDFEAAALNLVFVSSPFDLNYVASELARRSRGLVVGCTTSGHIASTGFEQNGAASLSFSSNSTTSWTWSIEDIGNPLACIEKIRVEVVEILRTHPIASTFGVLLIDGLCGAEEQLTASLFGALPPIPIVGGSAGDHLTFEATHVIHDGKFRQGIATFTLVSTEIPFSIISMKHHHPTSTRLMVTKADAAARKVIEFNGMPAAEAYAEAIDVRVEDLGSVTFSKHPLMVRVGDNHYIRSPQSVESDMTMGFYCALEEGVVLRIGESRQMIETLRTEVAQAQDRVKGAQAMLVFDCILRRLELEEQGVDQEAGEILGNANAIGFSTYGEQLDALHVNQTLVGIAFGGAHV